MITGASGRDVRLEGPRARGILAGVTVFTLGLAVAGVLVAVGGGGGPAYLVSISIAFVGVGVVGFFLHRGTAELPAAPIWAPRTLRVVAEAAGLPAPLVTYGLYALTAIGIVGNLLVPLLSRR